ncbi:MAG: substrate-binding domain-containing protein [Actinomycetota bacterium]|nr:substrate-binding domain-containing protein [Actinomycetota bacterium]
MGRHSIPDPDGSDEAGVPDDRIDDGGYGSDAGPSGRHGGEFPAQPEGADARQGDYTDEYADGDYADEYADDDYADDRPVAAGDLPPAGPSGPVHGGTRDGGEWTGSHRAVTPGRRGLSLGVIAALVTVVVVVGGVILWRFFGDALSERSDAASARCVDGNLDVAVLADPSIAETIRGLADQYNEDAAPVGDRCVKVGVKPAGSEQVINGFADTWPGDFGERPALWIPASGVSAARLEAATDQKTVSDLRTLVSTPVVLAVRPELKPALAQQNWGTLPSLQTNPTALDGLGLPGWGALKLALPRSGNADASYLAAEAVAAAASPDGAPATDGIGAINTLSAGVPELPADTVDAAMEALLGSDDPAKAPVHAVATTEQQVVARAASTPDVKSDLASWLPPGPVATADYPTVLLAGDWLSREQVTAASQFARFMREPDRMNELTKAGFRTQGGTPPPSEVTDFPKLAAPLSVGDDAVRVKLAEALTSPAQGSTTTIMLDLSMPAAEGDNTRMGNVVNALIPRVQALPPKTTLGLWTFDATAGNVQITTGPLSEPVGGQPRSAALTTTLDVLTSTSGGAVSFTTLRLVYDDAMANFREGQPNSVLVITQGPHTDRTLDGAGLEAFIRAAFDPSRPVAVNVIDFGDDSDRGTWETVARTTGGQYQNLATSDSPELAAAITTLLP